ncbi:hypothetical protein EHS13_20130 [Paenibacillus psychroresistens]|uniref:Uncharacterized protein n=1 Tax=Paenibacillus psychroresistens TaxID=1778678 RepID=A0A6B8RME2_9BACL|nr:hypothetical protein [Paenibacillus psychroresistens]QGQ97027.1 hypothetical protein EHS13_20130 [Paenibacillus psychroresistens]
MDPKTLLYMGQRVDAARELQKKIDHLKDRLAMVSKGFKVISIQYESTSFSLTDWGKRIEVMSYTALTEVYMINLYFDMTRDQIKLLEKELAEL